MKTIHFTLVSICFALIMMGAKGCELRADTDRTEYSQGDNGTTRLYNETDMTVHLPGCSTFSYEKLEDGAWVDQGPDVICVWEGIARPLGAGEIHTAPFVGKEAGTYRHRFQVGFGCAENKPMSQADCDGFQDVFTPSYEVTAPEQGCDHYGKTFAVGESFWDFDRCNRCMCAGGDLAACTEKYCMCTGDEWFRDYKAKDPETCAVIRFNCAPNQFYFSNECGCGCQQASWCEETYDCEPPIDCSFEQSHCPYSTFAM